MAGRWGLVTTRTMPVGRRRAAGRYPFRFFSAASCPIHPSRGRKPVRHGSGFIIRTDGYVLTNEQVVAGRMKSQATWTRGSQGKRRRRHRTDVALLKLNVRDYLRSGNSEQLKVGEWVPPSARIGFVNTIKAGS